MIRVAPRDIFNEANFLKNLAQLVRAVQSGQVSGVQIGEFDWCDRATFIDDPDNADWVLQPGLITVPAAGSSARLVRGINSRDPWPMRLVNDDWDEWMVFDEHGAISDEFAQLTTGGERGESAVTHQDLFSASVFMKCFGRVALNSIPGVGDDWPGFGFDEDAFMDEEWGLTRTESYWVLEGGLAGYKGLALELRGPRVTSEDNLWPLEVRTAADTAFQPFFHADGSRRFGEDAKPRGPQMGM